MKAIEIVSSGVALPENIMMSSALDERQGLCLGQTEKVSGIRSRHIASTETATTLAIDAIEDLFTRSPIGLEKVECLICASGTMEQAIPYNAAKVHSQLNLARPIPAFDINMTCLSALMAMDIASTMIASEQYEHILIVSSEVASVGIDWQDREVASLFGDGAAACLLTKSSQSTSGVVASHFATYSEGVKFCEIRGGGSLNHPSNTPGDYAQYGLFEMQGKEVYRLTARVIGEFIDTLFAKTPFTLADMTWVVPHQASAAAMSHLQQRLDIPQHKIIDILATRGNQIAASIPSALHELLRHKNTSPGDKVLLIGSSAGLSLGAMVFIL